VEYAVHKKACLAKNQREKKIQCNLVTTRALAFSHAWQKLVKAM
jgi:hypothetical protein